jgi:hypothetical protein
VRRLLPAFFGRLVLAAVQPSSKRKVQGATSVYACVESYRYRNIARFYTHQGDLMRLMRATAELRIEKIIITSVVAPL